MTDKTNENATENNSLSEIESPMPLKRLKSVLEIYGSNKTLWPQNDVALLSKLIETDKEAKKLFTETIALDRLLNSNISNSCSHSLTENVLSQIKTNKPNKNKTIIASKHNHSNSTKYQLKAIQHAFVLILALTIGIYTGSRNDLKELNIIINQNVNEDFASNILDIPDYDGNEDNLL